MVGAGLGFSFPTPTAPRNRLYKPLSPFCMISPASPLLSVLEGGGGEANSLNVVRVSECDAELCILSRAWESCSLSMAVFPDMEARESRLERWPKLPVEATGESLVDMMCGWLLSRERLWQKYCVYSKPTPHSGASSDRVVGWEDSRLLRWNVMSRGQRSQGRSFHRIECSQITMY